MTDIMLDLETLSIRPDAAIIVIGAIKFFRKGSMISMEDSEKFYRRITVESCKEVGLRIDKETLEWWKTQDKNVLYEALENPDRVPLKQALQEFTEWMGNSKYVWGNGDDFDCTILGEAFSRCGMQIPWKFFLTRDCRTLFDLAGIKKSDLPSGLEHHAIHDCYRQIVGVKRSLQFLGL
jgi:DNA polymerase III epsilon subunit-like protein